MTHAEKIGEFIFERRDLRTADVRSLFVDFLEAALDLRHDFAVLRREIQKFDLSFSFDSLRVAPEQRLAYTRAGMPMTVARAGTSLVTNAPAATIAPRANLDSAHDDRAAANRGAAPHVVRSITQSPGVFDEPSGLVARGWRSLMKTTPWPMNTSSSIVTPEQTNEWLEILQRLPICASRCTSTNAPSCESVADAASVKIHERSELHVVAQNHVGRRADVRRVVRNVTSKSSISLARPASAARDF